MTNEGSTAERLIRLLLIEDDETFRNVLTLALELEGFFVTGVGTGADALALSANAYNAILVDLGLPDQDGADVIATLASGAAKDAPILAVSGWVDQKDKMRALRAGAVGFKTKPVDPIGLAAEIRRLISRWEAEGKAALWNESYQRLTDGDGEAAPLL